MSDQVVYLKVKNAGTLALKYKFAVDVIKETEGTNVAGNKFSLSDYLVFGQVAGNTETTYATREEAWAAVDSTTGLQNYSAEKVLVPGTAEQESADFIALVVYMPTSVGNEANYKTGTTAPSIELGVTLIAKQTPYEADSFNKTYDDDDKAEYPTVVAAADISDAIASAKDGDTVVVNGTVTEPVTIDKPITVKGLTTIEPVKVTASGVTMDKVNVAVEAAGTPAVSVDPSVTSFTMRDSTILADTTQGGTHTAVSIPVSGKVVFTGNTISNSYNGVEFGLGQTQALADGSVISDNTFENVGNNAISIYNVAENATILIEKNTFNNVSDAVRLSNVTSATAKFVIKDNTATKLNDGSFMFLQDYTAKNGNVQDFTKYTIEFNNVQVDGAKLTDNTDNKAFYVWQDGSGVITGNQPNVIYQ